MSKWLAPALAMGSLSVSLLAVGLSAGTAAAEDRADPRALVPMRHAVGTSNIIGGTLVDVGEEPTVVAVLTGGGLCTGTLIHPEWILTAAHCISPASQTAVRFDSTSAFDGGTLIDAAETFAHPNFSDIGDNDIGLIRLETPMTDRPVSPLNRSRDDAEVGIVISQVGYGNNTPNTGSGTLRRLDNKPTISCSNFGGGTDANLICFSQSNGVGQCSGDSGGPTFAEIDGVTKVVGIASFVVGACDFGAGNTRVDAEVAFADETIGAELRCVDDGLCDDGCEGVDPNCDNCDTDEDCDDADTVCGPDDKCIAAPFTPGGLGAECTGSSECDSNSCASVDGEMRCTQSCEPATAASCPESFECRSAGASGACWPEGGCCSTDGGRGDAGSAALLTLLGALVLTRRRRRVGAGSTPARR